MLVSIIVSLMVFGAVRSWEQCTIEPIPGCTCWDVERPEVSCTKLDLYTLPELGNATWYSLDLSSNHLTSIVGLNGVSLRYLHIRYNQIRSLMGDFLEDSWQSLEWLDLSHNELLWIFKEDLEPFKNLRVLKLENNQLEGFLRAEDIPLPNLRVLHLHQNPLSGFINLPDNLNLDDLTLTLESGIEDMPSTLNVSTQFTITDTNLTNDWETLFSRLKPNRKLQTLNLINCGLKDLAAFGTSKFSRKLFNINLSHNELDAVPNFAYHFRPTNFKKVDLSYNRINYFHTSNLIQFRDLETIDLHHNHIRSITDYASTSYLNQLEFIRWMDFSDNWIYSLKKSHIPKKAFEDPGSLHVVLGNNKFDCSCDLKWLWKVAKNQTTGHLGFLTPYDLNVMLRCHTADDTMVRLIDYNMVGQNCRNY